jgi:hypothetical protein
MANVANAIGQLQTHLQILGYTVTLHKDTVLIAKHDKHANLILSAYEGGIVVGTTYSTTARAKLNRLGLLELLQKLNQSAHLVRYYVDDDGDFCIRGLFVGDYEATRFTQFLEMYNIDCRGVFEVPEWQTYLE